MKVRLKILSNNRFDVYHVKTNEIAKLGEYKGSVATVRRLIAKNLALPASEIVIEKMNQMGWY